MKLDIQQISVAATEAQALLTLVAGKLQKEFLEPHELFTLFATVKVAIDRLEVCHDVQFDALKTADATSAADCVQ